MTKISQPYNYSPSQGVILLVIFSQFHAQGHMQTITITSGGQEYYQGLETIRDKLCMYRERN